MAELQVIVDANFLMLPGLFGVDIESELDRLLQRRYKLLVPQPVIKELKQLITRGTPTERSAARIGLALTSRGEEIKVQGSADEAILKLAKENCVVGTNDAILRKEIRRRGVPVIYLRQKSHLAMDGRID